MYKIVKTEKTVGKHSLTERASTIVQRRKLKKQLLNDQIDKLIEAHTNSTPQ